MELVFNIEDLEQSASIGELLDRHPDWPIEAATQIWAQRRDILKECSETFRGMGERKIEFRYWKPGSEKSTLIH